MNPLPEGEDKCPHCGYQEGMPYSMTYLRPGTVLKERYLIGKVADKNSEGATYIAYDQTEDKKVLVREFMPEQIAERNESNQCIRPKAGYERQFKTALSDFVELSRQLLALNKISGIVPVLDRFVDNDTVYVDSLNAGQTQEAEAFTLITEETAQKFKNAEFKVLEVSKY